MKHVLNFLLILATLLNPLVSFQSSASAPLQPQAQVAATGTTQPGLNGAYPAPATPTPMPTATRVTPTPQPTAIPTPAATPTPPASVNRINLKTNLNCFSPEQDLSLDWDFQPAPEWAGRESALELVVSLPSAFTPDSKGWTRFDAQTGTGRLPLSKTGKLRGKLAKEISGALKISAKVVNGEKVVAETALELSQGSRFEITAEGGAATSPDERIRIRFPQGALNEAISLCVNEKRGANGRAVSLIGHAFDITAEGKTSKAAVRQFGQPVEIAYRIQPGEFGGDEASLSLMYYDEALLRWRYLPTLYDAAQHTVTGYSTHLTEFLYDINTIDKYKINDLSAFQVSEYTGAGTYALPLNLPPGPAGFGPSLNLSYSSNTSDAAGYHTQSSWVGMGWDLSVGEITRNENRTTNNLNDDSFSWQGQTLIPYKKGTDTSTGTDTSGLAYIEYQAQHTQFARIRQYLRTSGNYYWQGYSQYNWEGYCGTRTDTSFWKVWDKEGNQYKYDERMTYPSYATGYKWPCYYTPYENYKWFLTSATNPSGQVISYTYEKTSVYRDSVQ